MSGELLLAIDAGTGSCRAVAFDPEGRQVSIVQREYAHAELPNVPGSQVFDTGANWKLICACIQGVLTEVDPQAVCTVTATSMREGMVLYDGSGRELWACPNVDSRAGVEAAELVESGAADEIFRLSRRLGRDHRSGPLSLARAPRARPLLRDRPHGDAQRLGHHSTDRRVRRPIRRADRARNVRLGGARLVGEMLDCAGSRGQSSRGSSSLAQSWAR